MDRSGLLTVFTEGDRIRGLGHVSRCSAYAGEWRRRGGQVVWILDGDDAAAGMIGPDQEARRLRWQDWFDEMPLELSPTAILVDSYEATPRTLEAIAAMAGAKVYIDDLRRDYPAGLVVHPAPDLASYGASPSPSQATSTWLEGPRWQPLREPFWDIAPRAPARSRIERVLVVIGGGDLRQIGATMADLAASVFTDARIDLVMGAGQAMADALPNLVVHQAIDAAAMANLMVQADLAISAAGQTVFELARCGTPTVMVGIADNQRANLDHWPGLCGFVDAGPWDADDLHDRVRVGLLGFAGAEVRQTITGRAQRIVDGQGVRRLFDHLDQTCAERSD